MSGLPLEAEVTLGGDTDCETCGWSSNELHYSFSPVTGVHELTARFGCYGIDALVTESGGEAVTFVSRYADEYPYGRAELLQLRASIAAVAL